MSSTLQRMRNILKSQVSAGGEDIPSDPEIGFRISVHPSRSALTVRIIGARNLPMIYGTLKPEGYLVKVTLYPGREKFETEVLKGSSPCFNQEFKFTFTASSQWSGGFITLTVYAILETVDAKTKLKPRASFRDHIEAFIGKNIEIRRSDSNAAKRPNRPTLNNRRTVGAVTYNLERNNFTQDLGRNGTATPDIWRALQNITSGVQAESRESKKGNLEVTMCYSNSEDGNNDMIMVSLTKLRCSMHTMHDHEKIGGLIYLKMVATEWDTEVGKWKSEPFPPTISLKIEAKTATMNALVKNYNLERVKVVIRIKAKNMLQKKFELGQITIDKDSYIFKKILSAPSTPVTLMMDFK